MLIIEVLTLYYCMQHSSAGLLAEQRLPAGDSTDGVPAVAHSRMAGTPPLPNVLTHAKSCITI